MDFLGKRKGGVREGRKGTEREEEEKRGVWGGRAWQGEAAAFINNPYLKNRFAFLYGVGHYPISNTIQKLSIVLKDRGILLGKQYHCMFGRPVSENKQIWYWWTPSNECHFAEALRAEMPVWLTGTLQGVWRPLKTRCQREWALPYLIAFSITQMRVVWPI